MTKYAFAFILVTSASPAMAHHEVVVATSVLPMAGGAAVLALAAIAAVRRRLSKSRERMNGQKP